MSPCLSIGAGQDHGMAYRFEADSLMMSVQPLGTNTERKTKVKQRKDVH